MSITKSLVSVQLDRPFPDPLTATAAYWEVGTGEPIVFLHGFLGSGNYWQAVVNELSDRHRCICLDLLGFGDSSKPLIRYDIATLVAFVQAALEALELPARTLVGHSLGGWVAAAYGLAHPDRVRQLVLVAPAGIRDDSFCGRYDHLRPLLWQTPVIDWLLWSLQPLATFAGQRLSLDQLRHIRQQLQAQPAARSFLLDRLRPEDAIDTVEQDIHRLQMPTLVIAGERDETIPLWHAQTYADRIPDAQLLVLPEAGHDLPQANAPAIGDALRQFLQTT